jgi:hypothetical protein
MCGLKYAPKSRVLASNLHRNGSPISPILKADSHLFQSMGMVHV